MINIIKNKIDKDHYEFMVGRVCLGEYYNDGVNFNYFTYDIVSRGAIEYPYKINIWDKGSINSNVADIAVIENYIKQKILYVLNHRFITRNDNILYWVTEASYDEDGDPRPDVTVLRYGDIKNGLFCGSIYDCGRKACSPLTEVIEIGGCGLINKQKIKKYIEDDSRLALQEIYNDLGFGELFISVQDKTDRSRGEIKTFKSKLMDLFN